MSAKLCVCVWVAVCAVRCVGQAEAPETVLKNADAALLAELLGALAARLDVSRVSLCDRLHQDVVGKEVFLRRLRLLLVREGVQALPCFRGELTSLPAHHRHQSRPAVKTDPISTADDCLRSSGEKPGWKNSSCSSVPWPMQVFVTDFVSVEMTSSEALDAYEEDFGAVKQGILCINPDLQPYLAIVSHPDENIASLYFINYDPSSPRVPVTMLYQFRQNSSVLDSLVAEFSEAREFLLKNSFYGGPADLGGHTIHVAVVEDSPNVISGPACRDSSVTEHYLDGPKGKYCGFLIDVLELMAENLNFTYTFVEFNETVPGVGYSDGCIGAVGTLCRRRADISLMGFRGLTERLEVLDYTPPVLQAYRGLVYRASADTQSPSLSTYFAGFHWSVWLSVLLLTVTVVAVMMVVTREPRGFTGDRSAHALLFFFFGCLVQQGHSRRIISVPQRIVIISFWSFCVILLAFYNARLTSFLSTTVRTKPFWSLEEAIRSTSWSVIAANNTASMVELQSLYEEYSKDRRAVARGDFSAHGVANFTWGIAKIFRSKKALYTNDLKVYSNLRRSCYVSFMKISRFDQMLALQKNLPIKISLNNFLQRVISSGVLLRLRRKWFDEKPRCRKVKIFEPLDSEQVLMPFVILAAGFGVAFAALVYEVVLHRWWCTRHRGLKYK